MANIERRVRAIFNPPSDTKEKAIVVAAQKFLRKGGPDGGILDLPQEEENKLSQPHS